MFGLGMMETGEFGKCSTLLCSLPPHVPDAPLCESHHWRSLMAATAVVLTLAMGGLALVGLCDGGDMED